MNLVKFMKNISLILFILLFSVFINDTSSLASNLESQAYTLFLQGKQQLKNKNFSESISSLKQAQKLLPNKYEIEFALGMCYMAKALNEEPFKLRQATLLDKTGNSQNSTKYALDSFSNAIKINPDEWQAYIGMAELHAQSGLIPVGLSYFDIALRNSSMPKDMKDYYTRERVAALKLQNEMYEHIQNKPIKKPDIALKLSSEDWKQTSFLERQGYYMAEFNLLDEDIGEQWSKLVTIHFYDNKFFNYDVTYLYNHIQKMVKTKAKEVNDTPYINKISEDVNNIYLEWRIPKFNETEIIRIYKSDSGIYSIHFASKKPMYSEDERSEILNILRATS